MLPVMVAVMALLLASVLKLAILASPVEFDNRVRLLAAPASTDMVAVLVFKKAKAPKAAISFRPLNVTVDADEVRL